MWSAERINQPKKRTTAATTVTATRTLFGICISWESVKTECFCHGLQCKLRTMSSEYHKVSKNSTTTTTKVSVAAIWWRDFTITQIPKLYIKGSKTLLQSNNNRLIHSAIYIARLIHHLLLAVLSFIDIGKCHITDKKLQ